MSITSVVNDTVTSVSVLNAQKPLPPTITNYSVGGVDDTALDPAGGQTVQINGTGFLAGATITFDGSAVAVVTYVNSNQLTFTSPAKSAGTYTIYVVNPDGGTAIYIPGIIYSVLPTWTTGAGTLGSYYETQSISNTVVASGDAPITYSLYSGSLPTGSTLAANGVITGTAPVDNSSTTYSFTIQATDAQLQDSTRSFSLTINTDVVTWVSPANATTYTSAVDSAIANVTLSATDAAGYNVTYSANALPTGISLSGNTISGTPTVIADSSTLLTATAATTNRSATRTINWSITVANDPYFEYNTLLIPGASTTFVDDASTNNFAVTINGDTKPNSSNPYTPGYYSNYFDGSGDYLTLPDNTAFDFPGDFTVEAWVYLNTVTGSQGVYSSIDNGADSWVGVVLSFSGTSFLATSYISGDDTITHQTAVSAGRWYHIAIVRNGSSTKSYLNGVQSTSTTSGTYSLTQSGGTIGSQYPGSGPLNGYISNLRVVKGTAVYTSSFTPSTAPLTAISGTSLLTCQSNRFIDNSTNNFTLTVNGNTTVNSFQPFTPNTSYSTYGSAYFDGTGDYLNYGSSGLLSFGTGDFTVEAWIYVITSGTGFSIFNVGGASAGSYSLYVTSSTNKIQSTRYGDAGGAGTTTNSISLNTWVHVAAVRNSGTAYVYVNGVLDSGATYSMGSVTNTGASTGLIWNTNYSGVGYITDVRVVKGTAVYTTAFTPPSSPLTAIANTSLLTLQNNQSVNNSVFLDNSSNNFLVTRAGNATQGTFSPYGGNWSNYFDGTGDYLTTTYNTTSFDWWTTDYTIETWVYPTTYSGWSYSEGPNVKGVIGNNVHNTTTNYWSFGLGSSGNLIFSYFNGGSQAGASTTTATLNQWNHIAVVKNSSGIILYVNGTGTNIGAVVGTPQSSSGTPFTIGAGGGAYINGYISNIRIVKGTAVYTSNFTPPSSPLTAITNTSLLTCQSNRLIDNSINNYTITKYGDTSVQRFSPFNPSSVTPTSYSSYFDGTGDYLSIADSTNIQPGSGDLTYEFWWYPTTFAPSYQEILTKGTGLQIYAQAAGPYLVVALSADNSGSYFINNGPSTALSTNTWYHIAVTRSGNNYYVYLNGVQTLLGTSASSIGTGTDALLIGAYKGPLYYTTGYISNVRFVKGTAVYTSNFTPPTSPLTAISGTQLLTCQSPTFIDNSINNFTITAAGDAKPTTQNPFGYTSTTTEGYTVSTIGGSGYFDGSGDSLQAPSGASISGTGDFTAECWIYPTTVPGTYNIIGCSDTSGGLTMFGLNANGTIFMGRSLIDAQATTSNAVTYNTWNHIAISRSSGTVRLFINGIQGYSGTITTNYNAGTVRLGTDGGGSSLPYTGYISNFRIITNSAIYTSNFVPPAQPLTAVQNTSLLTSMTGAGIYDAAMMNDIETVGDAKLSTAVSKFGGSSMSFDGTGDYLVLSGNLSSGINAMGTGDFTIEFWLYANSVAASDQGLIDMRPASTNGYYPYLYMNNGQVTYWLNSTAVINSSAGAITTGTWYHVALSRSGSSNKLFINGTQSGSTFTSNTALLCDNNRPAIGSAGTTLGASPLNGYLDDLRITKGYARYTSNFTPPTTPFPVY